MGKASQRKALKRNLSHLIDKAARRVAAERGRPSPQTEPLLSLWREAPEDKRQLVESFDSHAPLRNGLRRAAEAKQHWAGIPMPLDGEQLIVEPRYPHAEALMKIGARPETESREYLEPLPASAKIRNVFTARSLGSPAPTIVIYEVKGKIEWGKCPVLGGGLSFQLRTLGCSDAWGIEQESNAVHTLGTLIKHRAFKQYLLTGMFLETSRRSGVTYLFRKLKPTIAMSGRSGQMRILASLCLHPIAFYAESYAGAMCPTDDVIAHLMLMRGDEAMFWKRANQHPASSPLALI